MSFSLLAKWLLNVTYPNLWLHIRYKWDHAPEIAFVNEKCYANILYLIAVNDL